MTAEDTAKHVKDALEEAARAAAAMSTTDTIRSFVAVLAAKAWQFMGLTVNPGTGKTEKKLDESRLAIDAIADLVKLIESRLSEDEVRQYRTLLQDLRLNFINQSSADSTK